MRIFGRSGKRESGFTLVEVMIVVAVFGIMAAIAIPSFMKLLPGMRLNGATREVMGALMKARMKPISPTELMTTRRPVASGL
jgi:type IV fimbrial biogenesis protein FimT